MHCDRATAGGFTCVDIYHAFSGTGENRSLRELTVDSAHPNQATTIAEHADESARRRSPRRSQPRPARPWGR